MPAGCVFANGYCNVTIDGVNYGVHRVIHKMRTGEDLVDMQVDHKDRDQRNNHPFNLRWADRSLQAQNKDYVNATGFRGVYFCEGRGKPFRAMARVKGKLVNLGYYATAEEAHTAFLNL